MEKCAQCASQSNLRRCTGCLAVRYCSNECQKEHWRQHKITCRKNKSKAEQELDAVTAAQGSAPSSKTEGDSARDGSDSDKSEEDFSTMAHVGSAGQAKQPAGINDWRQAIETYYPDWDHQTYCVPPIYFNRVPYDTHNGVGLRALIQQPLCGAPSSASSSQPSSQLSSQSSCQSSCGHSASFALQSFSGEPARVQESDTRDDFAQQHVMHCVQALGETQHEPMFVISQLNYADYLNKPAYAQAAQQLPRPVDLTRPDRKGDFDILILHMRYGILIGEIKCVGLNMLQSNDVVAKKVAQAVEQLDKSERVVRHITQDVAPGVRITKTLIFPYVTGQQMKHVILANRKLQQAVCATLDAPDVTTAVQLCLCADQFSHKNTPHDVTPQTTRQLSDWFTRRMSRTVDPAMTRDVYINVLARIVGPATTIAVHCVTPPRVEVRTLGEAVSELGKRLASVVLTPTQVSLINRLPCLPRVCLVGPPGTGKSLVLVLVGLHWLRAGHDVLVLSTCRASHAVSHVICQQLKMTLSDDPTPSAGSVRFHHCELQMAEKTDVTKIIQSSATHILMDEAIFTESCFGPRYEQLVAELVSLVPHLSLWAAALSHLAIPPSLHVEEMTVPLRSAPVIVREVGPVADETNDVLGYTKSANPSVSDGPAIIRLRHEGGQHAGRWPVECHQCGREVADVLRDKLRVGVTGPVASGSTTTSSPPLQYRDVLVLTRDAMCVVNNVPATANGFVTGLRDAGIPVGVVSVNDGYGNTPKVRDMALAGTDQVTMVQFACANGLERKVVVHVPGRWVLDYMHSEEQIEARDKLFGFSRCIGQLVRVDVPPPAVPDPMHPALMIKKFMAAYKMMIRNFMMAWLIRELMTAYGKHRAREKHADNDSD